MTAATKHLPSAVPWPAAAIALTAGLIFAAGVTLGGMTDPRKVQGFLDVGGIFAGRWDPSLAFVMGGAVLVSLIAFATVNTNKAPWVNTEFVLPTRRDIDAPLVIGALLFGTGWGIAGFCPGPALASVLTGGADVLYFVAAMLAGMVAAKKWAALKPQA
jgi:uncharacterized protein